MTPETVAQFQGLIKRYQLSPRALLAALAYLAQSPTKKTLSSEFRQFLLHHPAAQEFTHSLLTPPQSYVVDDLDKGLQAIWRDEGEK